MRALVRALMVTSGRAVMIRAAPLAGVMGIIGTIVFGGNGLRMRDVIALMHGSIAVRAVIWITWVALATPAVASMFDAPGSRTLRAVRPPRAQLVVLLLLLGVSAQVPLVILFARGAGVLAGIGGAALAIALCASASSRRIVLFACASALVAIDHTVLTLVLAPILAALAVQCAWGSAFEERGAFRIVRRSPPVIALALAQVARMIRSARGRLEASALVVFAGGGALALTLRNDPDARPIQRALVVLAFPLSIACALLAAPALETEARLIAILRTTKTRSFTMALAMSIALALPSTAFASTASAAAAIAAHTTSAMPLASTTWAAVIAAAVAVWARRASRARRSSTFLVGVIVIASAFTMMAAAC